MRGVGTARAAITIVNALPLGIGAAVGIEWTAKATAGVLADGRPSASIGVRRNGAGTRLIRVAARASRDRFARSVPGRLTVAVRSTVPVGRGLKSSSAVGSAVVLATARALGGEPTPLEVAVLSAEVGRATGVSATGAFDDALAGVLPGAVVTDNRHDREIRRLSIDPDLGVALWVPARPHPRSPQVAHRFRRNRGLARRAVDAALAGDWVLAMETNSVLVEEAMGYRYGTLREAVRSAGAVASGVSGLGPAFAALADRRHLARVLRALPRTGSRRVVGLFAGPGAGGPVPR